MYAHKKSIGTILKCDKDFTLETSDGTKYGFKGDGVLTDLNGEQHIVPKEDMLDYVSVQVVKQVKAKELSPFEEQSYKMSFDEMDRLNQEEAIRFNQNNTYEKVKERLFSNKAF